MVISYYETNTPIVICGYFQVWNYINKKLTLKTSATCLIFWNYFFRNYLLLPFSANNFFSIRVILDFVCTWGVNKGFTVFQNVLLSVMSLVLILLNFFFSCLIKLRQRLRCLLYTFLSMLLFVISKSWPFHFFIYHFIYERSLICTNTLLFYWRVSLLSAALRISNSNSLFPEVTWNILLWTSAINTSLEQC